MTDETTPSTPVSSLPPPPFPLRFLKTFHGKAVAAFILIAVLGFVGIQQVYSRPVADPFVRMLASALPLPAVSVGAETVSLREFLIEYDAMEKYFEGQGGGMVQDDLEKAIADTVVNKLAIQEIARRQGIELDEARTTKYFQDAVDAQGGEEAFMAELDKTFGWTKEEFRERVMKSIVLAQQAGEAVLANVAVQAPRREAIDAAYARLEGGEDFVMVAKDVHAGFSTALDTDLGYVKQSELPQAWSASVAALQQGEYSGIVELQGGFAVVKVDERIAAGDDAQLHLFSVSVPKVTLEDAVKEYLGTVKVKRYVGGES